MHTFSQITWEFILLRWTGEIHACRKIVPISFGTHILYTDPTYVYMLYMMYNYIRYMGSSVFFFVLSIIVIRSLVFIASLMV